MQNTGSYIYKFPHECCSYEDEQMENEDAEEFMIRAVEAWGKARDVQHGMEVEAFEEWKTIRALAGDNFGEPAHMGKAYRYYPSEYNTIATMAKADFTSKDSPILKWARNKRDTISVE